MTVTAEGVQRFFDENVPTQYHEVGHKVMDKCVETWGKQRVQRNKSTLQLRYGHHANVAFKHRSQIRPK